MNSLERVLATLQGEPTDRRAVSLTLSLYGARLTGCRLTEYYTNPVAYARGASAVMETFQPDILFGPFALCLEGEAFGSRVRFYEDQAPNLTRPAISSSGEIAQLAAPDIETHPRLRFFRATIRRMAAEHGQQVPIAAVALGPMGLPAMIMGIEGWLETLLFDEAGTQRMLEMAVPYFVRWANVLLAEGASLVVVPAAFANPTIVTREMAARIAVPALKEAYSQINGPLIVHSAGVSLAPFLDLLADLPNVVGFVLNHGDSFAEARARVGAQATLIGNIDGPTLHMREPDEIAAECRKVLHDRRDDPHFILGTSAADIGFDTPVENIRAVLRAAQASRL
ncbi:MAG: uroporphyrinogen decarboxylase family protein [Anaerolineae bacterium]